MYLFIKKFYILAIFIVVIPIDNIYSNENRVSKMMHVRVIQDIPDEYKDQFQSAMIKSYVTYNTKCGTYYSLTVMNYGPQGNGFCGTAGCEHYFFKETKMGPKFIYSTYLEVVENQENEINFKKKECMALNVKLSGLESKDMNRAGSDWINAKIIFKKNRTELIKLESGTD